MDDDVVIAVVHWGVERMTCPDGRQRDFAFELLRNGADAVIGQHPHVLQPVVFDDGKLVSYSLGNFVWHYRSGITGETGVLQIDFDGAEIVGWSFHPHLLDSNGAPVPASEGARVDRLNDIVGGDCARHQPPPITTPPTPEADTETETESEEETEPAEDSDTQEESEPEGDDAPATEAEGDDAPEAKAEPAAEIQAEQHGYCKIGDATTSGTNQPCQETNFSSSHSGVAVTTECQYSRTTDADRDSTAASNNR